MTSKILRYHLRQTTTHTTVLALVAAIAAPMAIITPAVADDTIIDSAVTTTNGGATLNGDDSLTITQSGSVTPPTTDDGVYITGDDNKITNSGTVTTDGNSAQGIYLKSSNNSTVTNAGTISTNGISARGILTQSGSNAIISNSGTISTDGEKAEGIFADQSNNATITNSGTISTDGKRANGIYAKTSTNASISNSGAVTTNGQYGTGLLASYSNGSTISNSGIITTNGPDAYGIATFYSQNATITNSGTIVTNGVLAHGANFSNGDNFTFTHTGTIATNGPNAAGIYHNFSDDGTITVSGSVISNKSNAFSFSSNDTTLNLNAPAFIGGAFNLGTGTNTKLNIKTGKSHSFLWTFDTTHLLGGAPVSITGPVPTFQQVTGNTLTITTFDPTTLGTSFESLTDRTGLLSGITRNRLSSSAPIVLSYAQTTETIIDKTFAEVESTNQGWAKVAGSIAKYDGDTTTLDSNHSQVALVAGYDWSLSPESTLGIMAGYAQGTVTSDSNFATSVDNDTKGLFIGAYGRTDFDNMFLRFGLTAGLDRHTDDRLVNDNLKAGGVAHAIGEYDSFWISPEITYGMNYALSDDWIATPSVRLSYAGQWMDGYTETGTSANATIGKRQIGVAELNLDYAATHQLAASTLTGHLGYAYRASVGDSTTDVTLLGTTQALANNSSNRHVVYLGGEALFNVNQTLDFEIAAQVEYSDDHIGGNGSLKLTSKF